MLSYYWRGGSVLQTKILGIDLSGKDGNPIGVCLILGDMVIVLCQFRTLGGLLEYLRILKPDIVAIDAPLDYANNGPYRDCDRELKRMGLNPLPLNMPSMRMLISRAKKLVSFLGELGTSLILETFPYASLRLLDYKRKPRNRNERRRLIKEIANLYDIKIRFDVDNVSKDKFDAFVCAVVGYAVKFNRNYRVFGSLCKIYVLSR